ncbi:MAG: hypothetical protein SFV51_13985, partial [Bryobacteraceae bacterium]|nr:hypothetical protein [Bryobacteraceae bacterium]
MDRVVFVGRSGPPSLTFLRTCAAMGVRAWLYTPGALDIGRIMEYARGVGAKALTAIEDHHCLWLAANRTAIEGVCKLMLPGIDCLELIRSKTNQIALAREAGMEILPTYEVRGAGDIGAIPLEAYPVCVRPAVAGGGARIRLIRTPAEFGGVPPPGVLIAQPLRVLPNLIIHGASREDGEVISLAAFLVDRKFEGVTLRMRPMAMPAG